VPRHPLVPSSLALLLLACGAPAEPPADVPVFLYGSDDELALAVQLGLEALADRAGAVGELVPTRVVVDDLGMAHARFQQRVGGVPVFGGEAIVHLHDDASLASVTDNLVPDPAVDTRPLVHAEDAVELALLEALGWERVTADPLVDLWVLRGERSDHLAWRVRLEHIDGSTEPSEPVLFIDAHSGATLWGYDDLHTATGTTNYYGSVDIETYLHDGTYYLEDTSRNVGTYSADFGTVMLYYIDDDDDLWTESWQVNGVEGHFAAAAVYDYYLDVHGRDGIDGSGGPGWVASLTGSGHTLSVVVDYGRSYANAFWAGDYMAIGGGDGSTFGSLSTLDIVGHEMTHGVVEHSAALIYANESGAVDESFADVFGAMVERSVLGESADTWTVGEACYTPGVAGDAARYMADPSADGFAKDHYDDLYTGPYDSGGVHDNAGIGYLAFYLASEGGVHPTYPGDPMYGVGADAAAAIWYRALTTYMTSSSDFADTREATLSAAADLYGATSVQYNVVARAWAEVGVGCHLGAPYASNYCSSACPCTEGEGQCDSDAECDSGLVCGENEGAAYGASWWYDVCVPGVVSCHPATPGAWAYCNSGCTCAEGEGWCKSDAECDSGLVCGQNLGASYGYSWWVDVCVPSGACHVGSVGGFSYCSESCTCGEGEGHCASDAECDAGHTCGVNMGAAYALDWWVDVCVPEGASCHTVDNGHWAYCSSSCTCAEGEGQCDSDAECDAGLTCTANKGHDYGLDWWIDVCM
jgi:Zn-dependent metalloprotease